LIAGNQRIGAVRNGHYAYGGILPWILSAAESYFSTLQLPSPARPGRIFVCRPRD
jgi:hypothetical protein